MCACASARVLTFEKGESITEMVSQDWRVGDLWLCVGRIFQVEETACAKVLRGQQRSLLEV